MKELTIKSSELSRVQLFEYQLVMAEVKRVRDLKAQMLDAYKLMSASDRDLDAMSDHIDDELFTEVHMTAEYKMLNTSFCPDWADASMLSADLEEVIFCG